MPTEIYLSKKDAPEEYETIDKEADKRDTDTVIEEIHTDAKMEEKEKEDGSKEMVEVEPAKDQLKIVKASGSFERYQPTLDKEPERMYR